MSIIVGFAVRNPAGIVLMRAFFSGLLFGTLVRVGFLILEKFIPEILPGYENQSDQALITETENTEAETEGQRTFSSLSEGSEEFLEAGELEELGEDVDEEKASPDEVISEIEPGDIKVSEGGDSKPDEEELEEIDEENEAFSELPAIDSLFEEDKEDIFAEEDNSAKSPERKPALSGDYIDIGNVQIPNEPETIAKAIRKVIKQD